VSDKGAKASNERLIEVLDEMDSELGPPGKRAEAWVRLVLGLSSSTPGPSSPPS
jgi:hypothetical protein